MKKQTCIKVLATIVLILCILIGASVVLTRLGIIPRRASMDKSVQLELCRQEITCQHDRQRKFLEQIISNDDEIVRRIVEEINLRKINSELKKDLNRAHPQQTAQIEEELRLKAVQYEQNENTLARTDEAIKRYKRLKKEKQHEISRIEKEIDDIHDTLRR